MHPNLSPLRRASLGPAASFALDHLEPRPMLDGFRYGLLRGAHQRPLAFARLDELARHIQAHRGRGGVSVENSPPMAIPGVEPAPVVAQVHALDVQGNAHALIGHVLIEGCDTPAERVIAALKACEPAEIEGEAA